MWTLDEEDVLVKCYETEGAATISKFLNRTIPAVKSKVRTMRAKKLRFYPSGSCTLVHYTRQKLLDENRVRLKKISEVQRIYKLKNFEINYIVNSYPNKSFTEISDFLDWNDATKVENIIKALRDRKVSFIS
jgi:hypothetical protein